ncbi:hypothetical protein GGQ54_002268 [Naumannella cuiyingiana]|uniref:Uncharacterized protein n=1 Tax=Naumannella cuiyingiana TaxID=1347891 RepID=A0A7Z0D9Z6_9ACTN|nr:hypothetical protein [Naumannella cuiyingiana]
MTTVIDVSQRSCHARLLVMRASTSSIFPEQEGRA